MELLKDILSQVGVDKTIYLQLILITLVYFLLSRIVFRKLLTILLVRKHQISGMKNMSEMTLFDYDKLSREYSDKWQKYEEEAERIRTENHDQSLIEANNIIRKANKDTDVYLKEKRSETLRQIIKIEAELEPDLELVSLKLEHKLTRTSTVSKR
jgi:F0F1-type ATP synthase membrane subunit b/b'